MFTSKAADGAAEEWRAADAVRRYLALLESGSSRRADPLVEQLERDFVAHAASYGARRGVTFEEWRAAGVGAEVLWRAGITRSSRGE